MPDIGISSSDETEECNEFLDKICAGVGRHQVVAHSMAELDFGVSVAQAVDVNIAEGIEVLGGKIGEVNRSIMAVKMYHDALALMTMKNREGGGEW
jgi:hypothetical protein